MLESKKLKGLISLASLAILASPLIVLAGNVTKTPATAVPKLAAVSPNASEDAIRLTQEHFFMGKEEVTVSSTGVRVENTSSLKFILVAKAPDWRIYVYRRDDKTYFSESLKSFEENGLMSNICFGFKDEFIGRRPRETEKVKVDGFDAIKLTSKGEKIIYLDIVTVPQEAKHILHIAFKVMTNGGIPLQYVGHVSGVDLVTGIDRKNEIEKRLDTTTIKRVKVSSKEFELPPGLTAINSMREVVAGKQTRGGLGDDDMKSLLRL